MAGGGSLGTLSIDVLANVAQMVSDLGAAQQASAKAAQQFQRDWQGAVDSVSDSFKSLIAIVGVGFSLEGIKSAIEQVTQLDTGIAHMSATFGISVSTFSDLNAAATAADTNLDSVTTSMTRLQKASSEAVAGNAQMTESFRALGISVSQLQSLSPDQLLQRVATALTETAPSAERTANMMALFGRNIAGIYPVLQQLAQGAHDTAVAFGAVITPDMTAKSEAYSQAMGHVKLAVQGLEQTFVQNVLPALTQAANEFAAMISTSSSLQTALQAAGTSAQFLADHLDGVVESAKTLVEIALDVKIAAWSESLLVTAESASGVTRAMAGIGAAATGAVAIGAAAFTGWQIGTWARDNFAWTAEIGQWIAAGVYSAQTVVVAAFQAIWTAVKANFNAFIASIQQGLAAPFQALADKLQDIAPQMAIGFQNIASSIKPASDGATVLATGYQNASNIIMQAKTVIGDIWSSIGSDSAAAGKSVDAMNDFKTAVQAVDAAAAHGSLTDDQYENQLQALSAAYTKAKQGVTDATQLNQIYDQTLSILASSAEKAGTGISTFNSNVAAGESALKTYQNDLAKLSDLEDQLASGLGGPYLAALKTYDKGVDEIAKTWSDAVDAGKDNDDLLNRLAADQTKLQIQLANTTAQIKAQHDVMAQATQQMQDLERIIQAAPDDQAALTAALKEYDTLLKSHYDFYGNYIGDETTLKQKLDEQLPSYIALQQGIKNYETELKNNQAVMQQWASIASNAFDSAFTDINKDIIEGGNVMKDLVNVAEQVVEAIMFEFEKLAIINPILNSIFGVSAGGGSLLPTLENSALGSLFSGATGGSGGIMSSLFGSSGTISNIFGSTAGSGSGIMGALFGGSGSFDMVAGDSGLVGMGSADDLALVPDYGGEAAGAAGDVGSVLGDGAGTTSGIFSAGGSVSSGLGAIGSIAGGALAGFQIGSQLGGTAGGIAGAVGLGVAAYMIPVVGWIAGAASLLNMVTGGGLFGTSWAPTGNTEQDVNVTGSGATASASAEESKKGALFSGRSWKTVPVAEDSQTTDAINTAFTQIQTSVTAAATALGETSGSVIAGSWAETMDKTGKVLTNTTTIAGQTFTDTSQQFFERIAADSEEALLPASAALTTFFNQFQSNADQLADAANMLVAAQIDVNKGMGLLGTSDTALGDIASEVQSLQQSGETLVQTYVRLQTEQMDVSAALTELGLTTNNVGADFVTFADSLSSAAGGLSNLNSELSALYSAYVPASTQALNSYNAAQKASQTALSAIGENPTESMSQFWSDFQAAMPNLTATQTQQWIAAGLSLASFTAAVTDASQKYAAFEISNYGDAFVSAMAQIVTSEQTQIDTANQLAQATGKAGASQQDIADIMTQTSLQMGKAISDLTTGINQDLTTLNAGNSSINPNSTQGYLSVFAGYGSGSADAANSAQQSTAIDLLQKIGDYQYATGDTTAQAFAHFGVNTGMIAALLGESVDQVGKQVDQQAQTDASMINLVTLNQETNDILTDLLDVAQGKAPSVDLSTYGAPVVSRIAPSGGSTGPQTRTAPTSASPTSSPDVVAAMDRNTAATLKLHGSIRSLMTKQRGTRGSGIPA